MREALAKESQPQLKKKTRFRWVVLTLIFLVYMIAGADRSNMGVIIPTIKDSFHMSNTDIGLMTSLFYLTYAAIQIPAGMYFGKKGVRNIFSISVILTSLATLFTGLASSILHLKVARLLLGAAEGPLNIGIVSTINRWFPPKEKGFATGIFMASIKFAPAVVPPLCAFIIITYGWRDVFYLFAIPGFITAALWWWLVKDKPEESRYTSESEINYINDQSPVEQTVVTKTKVPSQKRNLNWLDKLIRSKNIKPLDTNRKVVFSWSIWGCALGYFLLVGIQYSIMTWVPTYLVDVKGFSTMKMGFVASAPWIGAMIGNIFGGWLSDNVFEKRRKPNMILTAGATVLMMYSLIYAPNNPVILGALLLLTGIILNLGYSTFLVYPMGLASKDKVSFAASIINTAGSLGGAFAPFLVGLLLDSFNWNLVFIFFAGSALLTLFILFTMIEPKTEQA
ncbi:MFS transporter [Neobacillus drentensis]|uniref:MFS transporter n=1 Tax=Neobacillus drentensis TaxID=220684 RepID=UPI001F237C66|nr:MFS transporter [Neobacillus drentensis]ULT58250.1 MFS transporter [Neobacillus drentensis]